LPYRRGAWSRNLGFSTEYGPSFEHRHYSSRTEKAYISWIRRFIVFHGKRHPSKFASIMDPDENKVELWEPKVWDDKNKGA
jgi:hypothetical protein